MILKISYLKQYIIQEYTTTLLITKQDRSIIMKCFSFFFNFFNYKCPQGGATVRSSTYLFLMLPCFIRGRWRPEPIRKSTGTKQGITQDETRIHCRAHAHTHTIHTHTICTRWTAWHNMFVDCGGREREFLEKTPK